MKRIVLALVCGLVPVSAGAQQAYFPPPTQASPAPLGSAGTVLDDVQPAPDPYADSQRKLFFSNVELIAARIGSGAACGVITPGVGMQTMSDLLQYAQRQYGFTHEDFLMTDAYKAAYAYKDCAIWLNDPNSVAWLRQMGQDAMDATQANFGQMP